MRFRDLIIYTPFPNANIADPAPVFAFQLPTMGHIGAKKCYSARWALKCRALVGSGEVQGALLAALSKQHHDS